MAITPEMLNSTLSDLDKRVEMSFTRVNALTEALFRKSRVDKSTVGGAYIDKDIMGGAPGRGVGLYSGVEVAPAVRLQALKQLRVEYHGFFMPIVIPGMEARQNHGSQGIIKLVDKYPLACLEAFKQDYNKYLLTGTTDSKSSTSPAEFYGFTCVNGQFTSGLRTGTANGILDFRTVAQQIIDAETVENLVKQVGHVNQYDDIPSWSSGGRRLYKKLYRTCASASGKDYRKAGADIVIMDSLTFSNFDEEKDDKVRIELTSDKTEGNTSIGSTLYQAEVFNDDALDLSLFTGDAADGVGFIIDSDFWELCVLEDAKIEPFQEARTPDQDCLFSRLLWHAQLICRRLTAQGAISGGSV